MKPPFTSRLTLIATLLAGLPGLSTQALAVGSAADIQIFDRAANRRLPVYWHEGRAYVVGNPGSEYQISVANRAGADILAVVSVDGVNAVSGETASPDQTGYVLDTWRSYDIKGWRKSLDRTAAFYFTQLPDAYAARTGRPDNVGVIGVAVFRRRQAEPPVALSLPYGRPYGRADSSGRLESFDYRARPAPQAANESARDAANASAGAGAGADSLSSQAPQSSAAAGSSMAEQSARIWPPVREKSLGTGHGRSETSVVRNVAFERATTTPEEVITIYYDSQRNLMARGVIPPAPVIQPQPQPFPGRFAPDPPRG